MTSGRRRGLDDPTPQTTPPLRSRKAFSRSSPTGFHISRTTSDSKEEPRLRVADHNHPRFTAETRQNNQSIRLAYYLLVPAPRPRRSTSPTFCRQNIILSSGKCAIRARGTKSDDKMTVALMPRRQNLVLARAGDGRVGDAEQQENRGTRQAAPTALRQGRHPRRWRRRLQEAAD